MEHDEGKYEEGKSEDSCTDGTEAICPLPLFFLDGEIFESVYIVPEHWNPNNFYYSNIQNPHDHNYKIKLSFPNLNI